MTDEKKDEKDLAEKLKDGNKNGENGNSGDGDNNGSGSGKDGGKWIQVEQHTVNTFEAGISSNLLLVTNECIAKWKLGEEYYIISGISPFPDHPIYSDSWIGSTYYVNEKLLAKIKNHSGGSEEIGDAKYYCYQKSYQITEEERKYWISKDKPIKKTPKTSGGNSGDGNKSSSNSSSENKKNSGIGNITNPSAEEFEEGDDLKPSSGQNPSKTLRINFKVVNIYKLSDMNKFGKRAFRTKSNAGMLGGATAALLLNCAGIIGTPFTGGGSLAATAAITGAGAGIGWIGGKVVGEMTGGDEILANRGGIEFGVETGWGVTDAPYRAEYTIQEGQSGAKELCGNSIVPYITKGADKWEDSETKKYGTEAKGEFILNPSPESASAGVPKHYRENHCYFNFHAFGDDGFALYKGITPISGDTNKYGIKWWVYFTHYVGWRMNVRIGEQEDWLHYSGLMKEDYDNSSGLARWIAQGMIMLGTAYIGGKLLAQSAVANATTIGDAGIRRAEAVNDEILAKGKYKDGNPYRFGRFEQARLDAAESAKEDRVSIAQTMVGARAGSQMTRVVGRSFAGATRLFGGGKGSYQSGINEFIHNKAQFPPLRVEARTSEAYLERWKREINKRIADWDFYFGDDPELAEKKDFGKCQGIGSKIFANAHGKYQLSENTIFPQASPNPLIDLLIKTPFFIYTKCCGKQSHELDCKRPRLTKDDFYGGFKTKLTETISREGRKEVIEWTTTEEHSTTTDNDVTGTFGFVLAWCGSKDNPTNKIPLGNNIGTAGAFANTVFNGESGREAMGSGKLGDSDCYGRSEADIAPFKGRQYHKIYWGRISPSACGELEFGKGDESYNCLITRYEKGKEKEELVYTKETEESWVLYHNPSYYSAAGGLTFTKRSTYTETKTHRIERNFNPLNISNTISLTGFCGLEGWGDNPPDSFGGGGGTDVSIPHSTSALKEELGGMTVSLPQGLGLGTVMPESIQSSLNTEDINVDIKMPEMPQTEAISQAQQTQEQIWQHLNIGTSEQNVNTERGETPAEKIGPQKEKIEEK